MAPVLPDCWVSVAPFTPVSSPVCPHFPSVPALFPGIGEAWGMAAGAPVQGHAPARPSPCHPVCPWRTDRVLVRLFP